MPEISSQDPVYTITGPEETVTIPRNIINIAKSTVPETYTLESWILEWTEFGIEVSQKASSRKEAIDVAENISDAAAAKFAELLGYTKEKFGIKEGQLFEDIGKQIADYKERLEALEGLTDLTQKEKGFGKVITDLLALVDPTNTGSVIYKYQNLLEDVDDENGLVRRAVRAEFIRAGGPVEALDKILKEMNIESGKQQIRRKSAVKGGKFEDTLVGVLGELVGSNDISFQKTGNTIGVLPQGLGHNKKGDIRVNFGKGHTLHGNPIIIEAKDDTSFFPCNPGNTEKCAETYLNKAMENRECSVGIWIHNKKTAKHFDREFTVTGNTIFVVWDEDDPGTDWLLLAAIYIAMGRVKIGGDDVDVEERTAISQLISNLNGEVERYGKMKKFIGRIRTNAKHLDREITMGDKRITEVFDDAKELLNDLDGDSDHSNIEFEDSDSTAASEEDI